ncbi:MAG: hypothetical protein DRH15_15335, partial [Deltaproteobacteria bacterium]
FVRRADLEKVNTRNLPQSALLVKLTKDKNGGIYLSYRKRKTKEITLRTLKIKAENRNGNYYVYINNIPYNVISDKWEDTVLLIDLEWFYPGKDKMNLWERVMPGSRIVCIEGIGATADRELNKKSMTFEFYCDDEIRLYYRAPKRAEGEARDEGPLEFTARRVDMQFSEEGLLRRYMKDIKYRGMSMSLEEILWALYRDGTLSDKQVISVLKEYGISNMDELVANLDRISEDVISQKVRKTDWYSNGYTFAKNRILRKPGFWDRAKMKLYLSMFKPFSPYLYEKDFVNKMLRLFVYSFSPVVERVFDEFYTSRRFEGGLVIEADLNDEYFDRIVHPFFDVVFNSIMQGYAVRRAIYKADLIAPTPDKTVPRRSLNNISVKNNVGRSLEHDLRRMQEVGDIENAKKDLKEYIDLSLNMLSYMIDLSPRLNHYAFRPILDRGKKVLRLNKIYRITQNPFKYSRKAYEWKNITNINWPQLEEYYTNKLLPLLPESFFDLIVRKYFKETASKPVPLINPFDYEVIKADINYIKYKVDYIKFCIMHDLFRREKELHKWSNEDAFRVWIQLYSFLIKEDNSALTAALGDLYRRISWDGSLIKNEKWIDVFKETMEKNNIHSSEFIRHVENIKLFRAESLSPDLDKADNSSSPLKTDPPVPFKTTNTYLSQHETRLFLNESNVSALN